MSVMEWLAILFGAVAVGAWAVALGSAISIAYRAAPGTRIARYFDLGFWRFEKLVAALGPEAEGPISRYKAAFVVFLCAVLGIAVTATIAAA